MSKLVICCFVVIYLIIGVLIAKVLARMHGPSSDLPFWDRDNFVLLWPLHTFILLVFVILPDFSDVLWDLDRKVGFLKALKERYREVFLPSKDIEGFPEGFPFC